MRRATHSLTIGLLLCSAAAAAHALGFGRVSSTTVLGQPLNFVATVRVAPDETLSEQCVFADVFSGDRRLPPQAINIQLEPAPTAGERRVRVRSIVSIDEPVVTLYLSLGCEGRTQRKFVAFVDPPELVLAQAGSAGPSAGAAVPQSDADGSSVGGAAARTAAAQPSTPAPAVRQRPIRRREEPAPRVVRRAADTAVAAAAPKPRRTRPQSGGSRPAPGPVNRLKLEAAEPVRVAKAPVPPEPIAAAPNVSAAAPAASAPADAQDAAKLAAETAAAAEQLAAERARLAALEESLKRVRDETQAAQKALATLQARIKEAEAQRYANPLVYALMAISALLALAVAGLWWRQVRAQREAKWWGTVAPSMHAPSEAPEPSEPQDSRPSRFGPSSIPAELPKPSAKVVTTPEPPKAVWADSRQTEPAPDLVPEPRRDLSVEELIDLEQQAEFFVVLGQDDAAIDLLMGHVRSTGGISPLPYLKLLEIYRRRGDRSAYERIRERFNRRFNAYAPDWDADLQQGRSLEDYPATLARLEALWVMPQRVMDTLEASLFRRDETEEAFDLPAYRELLFLYAVARDSAHKAEDSSAVDLLLPMDSDAPSAPVSRLMPTTPSVPGAIERSRLPKPGMAPVDDKPADKPAAAPADDAAVDAGLDSSLSLELDPMDEPDEAARRNGISRR